MDSKMLKISGVLAVSLFANIALGFNVSSALGRAREKGNEVVELENKIQMIDENLQSAERTLRNFRIESNEEARNVVKSFFRTKFEFDAESQASRFTDIKEYVSDSVHQQLTVGGIPDFDLEIHFENRINDLQLYLMSGDSGGMEGLVLLDTTYTIENMENPPLTHVYQIKVEGEVGSYQITKLDLLGSFTTESGFIG